LPKPDRIARFSPARRAGLTEIKEFAGICRQYLLAAWAGIRPDQRLGLIALKDALSAPCE
jgi:hypothetical protein